MDNKGKRERSANFKLEDRELLIDIVLNHKSVIQNKKSDNVNKKKKEDAWKEIAAEYNSRNIITRDCLCF